MGLEKKPDLYAIDLGAGETVESMFFPCRGPEEAQNAFNAYLTRCNPIERRSARLIYWQGGNL